MRGWRPGTATTPGARSNPCSPPTTSVPERVRLQACLVEARLGYHSGDGARGRRSLGRALRLAEREQLRLPFALDRSWIEPVLRRDPQLAHTYRHLLPPPLLRAQLPAPPAPPIRP